MVNFDPERVSLTMVQIITEFGCHTKEELKSYFPKTSERRFETSLSELLRHSLIFVDKESSESGDEKEQVFYSPHSKTIMGDTHKALIVLRWMFQLKTAKDNLIYGEKIRYATISAFPNTLLIGLDGVVHLMCMRESNADEMVALVNELDLRDEIKDNAVRRIIIVDNDSYIDKAKRIKGVVNILQVSNDGKVKKLR